MHHARSILLATILLLLGLPPPGAAENSPPAPTTIGKSEKVCQLTGDVDWETGQPTAARTLTNFGLDAVDLGYPVEHNGKLILLFGDTRPTTHSGGRGPAAEIPPDDSVGFTTRRAPPGNDGKCLELQLNDQIGQGPSKKVLAPPTIVDKVKVKQGWFNVPSGGVSVDGGLFGFFWTNHCTGPARLQPSPAAPLARPMASSTCSESDDRNSIGRNVLARSADDGRTFRGVVPMPIGFVYVIAVDPSLERDVPPDQRPGILVFGVPRYRASAPYLAQAPFKSFADPSTWRYFVGRDGTGQPRWVSQAEWSAGGAPDLAGTPAWRPPGEAVTLGSGPDDDRCVGEFSVTWNAPLRQWLMLYACRRMGVFARVAAAPWGPWSAPSLILDDKDDALACRLFMTAQGCGDRRNFQPGKSSVGEVVPGTTYAPFVLNRYTTAAPGTGPGRASTVYWLISTWNPYEVTVMRSTLHVEAR
jgi:Domain of unknown function (DUF4185)